MAKAKKRRKTTRKRKKQQSLPTQNLLGLAYVLVALLGYFGRGFLGMLVANMFRIFVGSLSPLGFVLLFFMGSTCYLWDGNYGLKALATG